MSLADIVSVTITRNTKTPTRKGFGIPLLACAKVPSNWGTAKVKSFSKLGDLTDAGFAVTDPAYLMATVVFSQNPAPKKIKIGRRLSTYLKIITLTVVNVTAGYVYSFSVKGTAITYTVLSGATTSTVATALAALINAISGLVCTASVAVITITPLPGAVVPLGTTPPTIALTGTPLPACKAISVAVTLGGARGTWTGTYSFDGGVTNTAFTSAATVAMTGSGMTLAISTGTANVDNTYTATGPCGVLYDVAGWAGENGLLLADTTVDPGIATDLAAFQAYDGDWYGLALDSCSKLEGLAAAAWVEANVKLFVADTSASACVDPASVTDAMYLAKSLSYARTGYFISTSNLLHWTSCGILGNRLPVPPGSDTWKFKTLAGVPTSVMVDGDKSAVYAKHGNTYTELAGISMTENGTTAANEFFDVIRFVDWLQAEIQIAVFGTLVNAPKIPFTDAGADVIKATIQDRLDAGVVAGGLASNPAPFVEAPLVADVATADKAVRNYPDITFAGRLAGAIHSLDISGVVSV